MIFGIVKETDIPPAWSIERAGSVPYLEYRHNGVRITIEKRPSYCDRGNWIAKITNAGKLWIDWADGWPRYYFDLKIAFSEIKAFLAKRQELPPRGVPDDRT